MGISGLVVHADPNKLSRVRTAIATCSGTDIHTATDDGIFVVIVDLKDENKAALNCARQAHKVLKPGGVLLMLTYAQPSTRWPVIGWSEDPALLVRFNAGLNWRLCEAFALPKESADPASADFEIEEAGPAFSDLLELLQGLANWGFHHNTCLCRT